MDDHFLNAELADLRHDLCTPINQILGYSEMLEEDAAEEQPDFVDDLRKIQQAANTMLAMVRERLTEEAFQQSSRPTAAASSVQEPSSEIPAFGFDVLPVEDALPVAEGSATLSDPVVPGRILVVDDDALNRDVLAERLTRQGHIVTTAADGEEALVQARQHEYDLILLDVMMPRLDGYGALRALKADEHLRFIPVIMVSALDELSSVVRCIEIGAHDYLPKPFNATLLRARVGACLREKARHDQEVKLYRDLLQGQQSLERELERARSSIASLDPALRDDPRVTPLLAAFTSMTGAVQRRESDLRITMQGLEIKINRQALKVQVGSIVSDPSFSALSERARAMRERRQRRGGAK